MDERTKRQRAVRRQHKLPVKPVQEYVRKDTGFSGMTKLEKIVCDILKYHFNDIATPMSAYEKAAKRIVQEVRAFVSEGLFNRNGK